MFRQGFTHGSIIAAGLGCLLWGCGSESPRITKDDLLGRMEAAGLQIEPLDDGQIPTAAIAELPREPKQVFLVRVSDGKGNATPMTFAEFDSPEETARIRGVNGFPVQNWYVVGIVNNYFRDAVVAAAAPPS